MASISANSPLQHADIESTHGYSYVFAEKEMLLELQDTLDVLDLGVIALEGDYTGSGTDTLRVTDFGNVGFSLPMTALGSEVDTVAPSPVTLGYEEVPLGMYGLSHSETYKQQLLGRNQGVSLDKLKMMVPASWAATFRQRVCVTGATITTAVGSATTTASVDDHLDLATAYRVNLGSKRPAVMLDPQQADELVRSYRNEPAFQNSSMDYAALLGLTDNAQIMRNVGGLGMDLHLTDDVQQAGGAYQGFAFSPGGIGWARASTGGLKTANPNSTMLVPEFGLVVEELTEGTKSTTRQYRATAFIGFALGSSRVFTHRRWISVV